MVATQRIGNTYIAPGIPYKDVGMSFDIKTTAPQTGEGLGSFIKDAKGVMMEGTHDAFGSAFETVFKVTAPANDASTVGLAQNMGYREPTGHANSNAGVETANLA